MFRSFNYTDSEAPLTTLLWKRTLWAYQHWTILKARTLIKACRPINQNWCLLFHVLTYGSDLNRPPLTTKWEKPCARSTLGKNVSHLDFDPDHLTHRRKNYSVVDKEGLTAGWAIQTLQFYIQGTHFTVYSDKASYWWVLEVPVLHRRLMSWRMRPSKFDFDVRNKKGPLKI